MGEQSMWDDLLAIKEKLEAIKPKIWLEVIFVTRSALLSPPGGRMYRFEYQEKWYAVIGQADFYELKSKMMTLDPPTKSGITSVTPSFMMGIPVVENDDLLREKLAGLLLEEVLAEGPQCLRDVT